jgi:hypothetical protein
VSVALDAEHKRGTAGLRWMAIRASTTLGYTYRYAAHGRLPPRWWMFQLTEPRSPRLDEPVKMGGLKMSAALDGRGRSARSL